MKQKLKNNIEDYGKLKAKLDLIRKELTMTTARIKDNVKFEKRTEMFNEILSRKISPFYKTRLGYDNSFKTTSSTKEKKHYQQREMKEDLQNLPKNCKRITSLVRIEDLNSGKLRDQERLPSSGMKIFFLVTSMLVEAMVTKLFIVNPMQEIPI